MYHNNGDQRYNDKQFTIQNHVNDPIIMAIVYSDGNMAMAIQFQTKSGTISPMYGAPQGEQLVGIYGRYGDAMDSLGFAFISSDANTLRKEEGTGASIVPIELNIALPLIADAKRV